jgi:hypothetical protein
MTEHAPGGITRLFDKIKAAIPAAINSGIVGDQAHDYGYHRARNYLPSSDYSVQYPEDRAGDGEAASGLDLSWTDAQWQYTVSQRLLNAANDSRMHACREFYGSVDGHNVIGYDYYEGHSGTSDDTHLWHIHISVLRQFVNDDAALDGIAQVITAGGSPAGPSGGDDDLSAQDVEAINDNTNHNTGMIVYGDGRDVGPDKDTHPDNLKRTRQDVAGVKGTVDLMLYGDGRAASVEH